MPTQNVTIQVNQRGAQATARSVAQIGGAANTSALLIDQMNVGIRAFIAAEVIQGFFSMGVSLANLVDQYILVNNQIAQTTSSQEELIDVTNRLF